MAVRTNARFILTVKRGYDLINGEIEGELEEN